MHDSPLDPSRPRPGFRRWWSGVWSALRGRRFAPPDLTATPPPLDARLTVNHTETITFDTPARGDAYDFTVAVDLCLCATGTRIRDELSQKIRDRLPDLIEAIKAAVRPVARRYAPYRPGEAEQTLCAAVREAAETALAVPEAEGVTLTCGPRVRVAMNEAIRELQRAHVAQQVAVEARHELSALVAERLGELRVVWRDFIAEGLPDWKTPYALHMAQQPEQATKVAFAMRRDRRDEARTLVETVAQVASGHERLDLLEFAVASDSALRKTYELLGVELPDPGPDSLFSAPQNGSPENGSDR